MIILDTNIISELKKDKPDKHVFQWFDSLEDSVVLTTITTGELQRGVMFLPEGRWKARLTAVLETILSQYGDTILDYDNPPALAYGSLCADLRAKGIGISQSDAMIAAITSVHGATLATRNDKDFLHCGIPVINPF